MTKRLPLIYKDSDGFIIYGVTCKWSNTLYSRIVILDSKPFAHGSWSNNLYVIGSMETLTLHSFYAAIH